MHLAWLLLGFALLLLDFALLLLSYCFAWLLLGLAWLGMAFVTQVAFMGPGPYIGTAFGAGLGYEDPFGPYLML